MKKLIAFLALVLLPIGASGNELDSEYVYRIEQINRFEQSGNTRQAFLQANALANILYKDLRVNDVVIRLQEAFTEMRDEVVTETYRSSSQESFSASGWILFLGSADASSENSQSESYDVTKIITRNPEETSRFQADAHVAIRGIRQALTDYVISKSTELVLLKEAGIKAFQLARDLREQQREVPRDQLEHLANHLGTLNFLGEKTITSCVQTNYTNRSKDEYSSASRSAGISTIFFGASIGDSSHKESHWRQYAHSVKTCQSSVNSINANVNDLVYSINLSELDRILLTEIKKYHLNDLFDFEETFHVPTFGSPFFK